MLGVSTKQPPEYRRCPTVLGNVLKCLPPIAYCDGRRDGEPYIERFVPILLKQGSYNATERNVHVGKGFNEMNAFVTVCRNCQAKSAPLCWADPEGKPLCNSCGIFYVSFVRFPGFLSEKFRC